MGMNKKRMTPLKKSAGEYTPPVNAEYNIPYLAEPSHNGQVIYIDKDLPQHFKTSEGVLADAHKYLMIYVVVRKTLMDRFGFNFKDADDIAQDSEVKALARDFIPVDEYYAFLSPYYNQSQKIENIKSLPVDLCLSAYKAEGREDILQKFNEVSGKNGISLDDLNGEGNPSSSDPTQLAVGEKVEMEHTSKPDVAQKIASDHLAEHAGYYPALKQMEQDLSAKGI